MVEVVAENLREFGGPTATQKAIVHVYNNVTAPLVHANFCIAHAPCHRQGKFVAVAKHKVGWHARQHVNIQLGKFFEIACHLVLFEFELLGIVHVHQSASATLAKVTARGIDVSNVVLAEFLL